MDLSQNSIRAKADCIKINLKVEKNDFLKISLEDNGCGMRKDYLKVAEDPFTTERSTRKVGMGIPFFKQACLMAGGNFRLDSVLNQGTVIEGSLAVGNIDRIPLGDIGETMKFLIISAPEIRYILNLSSEKGVFDFDTDVIKETLEEVPINKREILEWIKDYINENVSNIFGGVLNEIHGRA